MAFPTRKLAILFWIVAVAIVVAQQITHPILFKGALDSAGAFHVALDALTRSLMYGGSIAAIGAIIHLLGEIRDALPNTDRNGKQ